MKGLIRFILLCSFMYGGWSKITSHLQQNETYVIIKADGTLSKDAREIIKVCVQNILKKAIPLNEISLILQKTFPYIERVAITKHAPNKIILSFNINSPIAIYNNNFVLCQNDVVSEAKNFKQIALKNIPSYTINNQLLAHSDLPSFCKSIIKKCTPELHESYFISLHDAQTIYLHNKKEPKITLVLNEETLPLITSHKIAYNKIENELLQQHSSNKKSKKNNNDWQIDGRFKNQIIALPRGVLG